MSVAKSALAIVSPLHERIGRKVVNRWHIDYLDLVEIRVDEGRQEVDVARGSGGPMSGVEVVVDELVDERRLAYPATAEHTQLDQRRHLSDQRMHTLSPTLGLNIAAIRESTQG